MGMFDLLFYNGENHQTKDFDCLMHDYIIIDGRLFFEHEDGWGVGVNYSGEILTIDNKYHEWQFRFEKGNLVEVKEIYD